MSAEILSVGSELLRGETVDTNSSYLSAQLSLLGIPVQAVTQIGDNQSNLVEALRHAWQRSSLILTTGGLGPTQDDLTREAIAEMLGEQIRVDPVLEQEMRAMFARWGRPMPPHNIKQATLIPSARSIPNPRGTAPGWWIEKEGRTILVMPGPPSEMERMWRKEILPRLIQENRAQAVAARTIKTFGLAEAEVSELASPLFVSTDLELGIYAKPDGIHLRLIARSPHREEAERRIQQGEAEASRIFAGHIWGVDDETLEDALGALLISSKLTLATMESCTGGLLAATISNAEKGHVFYKGGLVIHPDELIEAFGISPDLIAQYGTSSAEAARAMAATARKRLRASVGIGISGIINPENPEQNEVFIAVEDGERQQIYHRNYPQHLSEARRRATIAALFQLRQLLLLSH